ncbi:osmotin-like protein [Triticum urartu]|uniref:osmotin-like protein n=1 Tax=Triticum urartu TaxID=4572 RepID=UPI00204389C8|nr:osmotin-like protein [Triticum urartu]
MASPKLLLLLATLLPSCGLLVADFAPMTLTVVNNCAYPIWPGIQGSAGSEVLEGGGFFLPSLSHRSFPAPAHAWSGRVWARTGCAPSAAGAGQLRCATGDCGGRLQCGGLGGAAPATLAQVSLHHGGDDQSSYGVSVVDGFNVGLSVTPHEGRGNCPVLACRKDLTQTCPGELQVRAGGGGVAACKSGCLAFGTDELCCRGAYNSPAACRPSRYSDFFKSECPQAFTYAHDSPSLTHQCSAPRELKVIFCH